MYSLENQMTGSHEAINIYYINLFCIYSNLYLLAKDLMCLHYPYSQIEIIFCFYL